jgi:hypothetical protein
MSDQLLNASTTQCRSEVPGIECPEPNVNTANLGVSHATRHQPEEAYTSERCDRTPAVDDFLSAPGLHKMLPLYDAKRTCDSEDSERLEREWWLLSGSWRRRVSSPGWPAYTLMWQSGCHVPCLLCCFRPRSSGRGGRCCGFDSHQLDCVCSFVLLFLIFLFSYSLFSYFLSFIFIFSSFHLSSFILPCFYIHIIIFTDSHVFKKNAAHVNSMHSVRKMFHRTEGIWSDPGIFWAG